MADPTRESDAPTGADPGSGREDAEGAPSEATPEGLREGVRSGILAAIQGDVELRGGRTARRLVAAGLSGILGAIGVTLLVARHPFGHHPSWHVIVFSAVWAGLLVVGFAIAFLELRTARWPLARSAAVALAGLGAAGLCGALCPDPHFLHWWSQTPTGEALVHAGGTALGALCFGVVTALFVAAVAAFSFWSRTSERASRLLPASMLFVLLAPGVALQSVGTSAGVLVAWLGGTAVGAYAGVAGGAALRSRLDARLTAGTNG